MTTTSTPSGLPFDRRIVGERNSGPKRALVQEVEGQLLWAPEHAIQQRTREGVWVAPPQGAIWVPPFVMHKAHLLGPFFRFQVAPDVCQHLPARACLAPVTAALRDALLGIVDASERGHETSALSTIVVRELSDSGLPALDDPFPLHADGSVLARCGAHVESCPRSLAAWARLAGTSPRVLSQQIESYTGIGFGLWQRRVRLLRGLQLLAAGYSVEEAGRRAGYRSTGHWITVFKDTLGTTPGRYFARLSKAAQGRPSARVSPQRAPVTTRPPAAAPPSDPSIRISLVIPEEGRRTRIHHHHYGELLWPSKAMSLTTDAGTWVAHERLALWLPPEVAHETQASGGLVRVYSIRHALCSRLPARACPVQVTPALARTLSALASSDQLETTRAAEAFLNAARAHDVTPLPLPLLRPQRTVPIVDALRLDPSLARSQGRWAEHLGMARSTLARACEDELGMPFGKLRRVMQIRRAVEHLTLGSSVREAARLVGYAHVPKFIAMFKAHVGTTPARYVRSALGAQYSAVTLT